MTVRRCVLGLISILNIAMDTKRIVFPLVNFVCSPGFPSLARSFDRVRSVIALVRR